MNKIVISKEFANFINKTSFQDIPEDVIEKAKLCLLDLVFVADLHP